MRIALSSRNFLLLRVIVRCGPRANWRRSSFRRPCLLLSRPSRCLRLNHSQPERDHHGSAGADAGREAERRDHLRPEAQGLHSRRQRRAAEDPRAGGDGYGSGGAGGGGGTGRRERTGVRQAGQAGPAARSFSLRSAQPGGAGGIRLNAAPDPGLHARRRCGERRAQESGARRWRGGDSGHGELLGESAGVAAQVVPAGAAADQREARPRQQAHAA